MRFSKGVPQQKAGTASIAPGHGTDHFVRVSGARDTTSRTSTSKSRARDGGFSGIRLGKFARVRNDVADAQRRYSIGGAYARR